MDWKLFVSTFGVVFLAELGDKTQLATFGVAAGSAGKGWAVFLGSALALVATSAIAVLAGSAVGHLISPRWLERLGGAAFVALGAWMLWRSFGTPAAA